jgi:hypothetical protein
MGEIHRARNSDDRRSIRNTAPRRSIGTRGSYGVKPRLVVSGKNQPSTLGQIVELSVGRAGRPGVDIDHIGSIKRRVRAVPIRN